MDEYGSGSSSGGETPLAEGMARMKEGRFFEAAAVLRRAVEENPSDETGWRLLGGALASAGDPEGAIAAFEQAVALAPASARNYYNLAVGLQAAGRDTAAIRHLEQALALEPNYAQARAALDSLRGALNQAGDDPPAASMQPEPRLAPIALEPEHYSPPSAVEEKPVLAAPPYDAPPYAAPPLPVIGQHYAPAPVNGTLILVFGILSIVICGILGPVAWIMGNSALRILDTPGIDQMQRGTVVAGRICGIIGTVFLMLGVLYFALIIVLGVSGALGS